VPVVWRGTLRAPDQATTSFVISGEEISEMVVSGVRAFRHGYVCSRL
jgi:hypothetical protein